MNLFHWSNFFFCVQNFCNYSPVNHSVHAIHLQYSWHLHTILTCHCDSMGKTDSHQYFHSLFALIYSSLPSFLPSFLFCYLFIYLFCCLLCLFLMPLSAASNIFTALRFICEGYLNMGRNYPLMFLLLYLEFCGYISTVAFFVVCCILIFSYFFSLHIAV